ncbi:hypothetical protein BBO99_00007049 [Phytophthora kernoviae]|uniref:ABC transporter domain-containing protein n=2 Tax=Phytophthora kernoviae TaxID=325452 RepID=A0A3R7HFR0_9STRA|nr:hypothetical protein G195_006828 [Phytophthora kernoviae 00238/432]KAG2520834.1 hypothetical protein JM16_005619 [Phytophthora kernoviae]KAG2521880.1 hypothetical protein JM18_006365 [Phytophthora kernoviae]RLN21156.1 hypothetical protein BBI17_007039 [Phytophthora kernoviae]RLN77058.1 hypothetical protein BBO99_00007049 [Phytophthora kernoviae]
MHTLLALNAQRRVREKHAIRVRITEHERTTVHGKQAILQSLLTGGLWAMSAVGLWYGGKKVYEGEATPSEALTAFGLILLDGREMTTLDVTWMRAQMGAVTQNLTLFKASIYDNIAMGLIVLRDLGGRNTGQVEERVINAAQRADVHEFIMSLPDGYNTRVGENGAIKLSTQQRQRIALARALIREPKLLMLDEVALSPQELLSRFGGAIGAGSTTMILFTRNVSWMLTLVLVAALPLLLIGETIHTQQQMKVPTGSSLVDGIEAEGAVEVHTNEALRNRQAVVMLGLELSWCSSFETLLQRPLCRLRHKAQLEAVARGFCAVVMVAACALACWLSGVLVHYGDATFRELVHSLLVVTISALSLGIPVAWLNGTDGALQAGSAICTLRDAANAVTTANGLAPPPSCESSSEGEQDPIPQSPALRGSVTLHNIHFAYPTRTSALVLDGLSLHIEAGQTVALCGPTGAGKSTVLELIERFYDLLPAAENGGRILLDGVDTRVLDVAWMRAQISFVGSEPTLFLGTIAENIAYGMAAPPSLEAIVAAAEVAHAHAFISRLPDGYATRVGGELQFSPGQRQRIALARSVLQDPRLLLLDEPTRSLGAECEKIAVQQALDTIVAQRVRRTTVIAAHPAQSATARNADTIFVLDGGRVVDQGTHTELLELQNGIYARLLQERAWSPTSSSSYTVGTSAT